MIHRSRPRIVYLSDSPIPSFEANSIHVIQISSSLSAVSGEHVNLIHPSLPERETEGVSDVESFYQANLSGVSLTRVPYPQSLAGQWRYYPVAAATRCALARPKVVLSRSVLSAAFAARLGVSLLLELHMLPSPGSRTDRALHRVLKSTQCIGVIAITSQLKRAVQERYAPRSRVHVVPDASVDMSTVGSSTRRTRASVGYVGSFLPGKGVSVVCKLAERMPNVDFHLVGGAARDLPAATPPPNLILHGRVPPSQVPDILNQFDVCLVPNQPTVTVLGGTDIGPFTSPLKVFEAMSARRPIVASDLENLREVLEDGRNALLVPHDDIPSWKHAVESLLRDKSTADRIAQSAREEWAAKYSWNSRAARLLELARIGDGSRCPHSSSAMKS